MTSIARKLIPGIVIALIVVTATFAAGSPLVVTATPTPITALTAGTTQQFSATSGGVGVRVFWSVSGVGCSGFGCGSINFFGLYTAPSNISSPILVTITAVSSTNWTSTGSDTITVNPSVSQGSGGTTVSITGPLQLNAGASQLYTATVVGPANTAVTWSVGGTGCGGNCGTITQGGVYTAPTSLSSTVSVIITATSQATPSASASVTVQVTPVIAVTIGQFNPQMAVGTSQQFTATVTGTNILTVKWSVSGAGCSGSACGTITSSGIYTAPASVSSTLNVTVKATANADTSKFATAAVAVGPIVSLSVSPTPLSLSVNAGQQFSVSVTGTSNTAVTWSVSGAGCSGATCGMVSPVTASTAFYQAPTAVPSPASVNVTATLNSDHTKIGSAVVTIVPPSNSRLSGQYAFLFKGFDSVGPYLAAGSFFADGNGNLTSGVEDINCGLGSATDPICALGPITAQAFSGTYTVNADGRGSFTINPVSGPSYTFALTVESSNAKARFIESDASGIRGSGVLELQTPSAFATSALSARFAFDLAGLDSAGNPIAAIGAMSFLPPSPLFPTPTISAGIVDINDNGVLSCYPTESGSSPCSSAMTSRFTGTYNVSSNGRGTASFTLQGFSPFNFSLYVISSGEFFIISLDDPGSTGNPVFSGQALQQTLAAGTALQPGPAVFSWSGSSKVPPGSPFGTVGTPQAAIGQVSIYDTAGNLTVLDYDLNNGGTMTWLNGQGSCSTTTKKGQIVPNNLCTYAVQPNGDIVFSTTVNNNQVLRMFPTATNTGFVMGLWPSVTVGKIEPQVLAFPAAFSFASDLTFASNATLLSGVGSLTSAVGPSAPLSGNADQSSSTLGFTPDLPFSGTYSPTGLPNGRSFMYLNSTNISTVDFWVVTYNKMLGLDVDSGAPPTIIVFEH